MVSDFLKYMTIIDDINHVIMKLKLFQDELWQIQTISNLLPSNGFSVEQNYQFVVKFESTENYIRAKLSKQKLNGTTKY